MLDITRQTANFIASLKPADLPDRCREAARTGIVDCVGVMIAGAAEQPVRIVSAMLAASTQNDGAPEIPSGRNLAASDAALVNGVAAHVLDYDDVALALKIHNGLHLTAADLQEIGERIVNLNRLFNARFGVTRKDDCLPERLIKEKSPIGPSAGQVVELDQMLDEYYSVRGWNLVTGLPLQETLERLGLE